MRMVSCLQVVMLSVIRKDYIMIENIELAYCMACLENKIRAEKRSADIYLYACGGEETRVYRHMITRWSTMITAFETAFGVGYFMQY